MNLIDLPVEIIESILGYLPRHAKQECLLVCKAWHQVTLPGLNRYIQLTGSEDVMVLFRKMFHAPITIRGIDIRCLSLTAEKASDRYIVRRDVLGRILNACPHLRALHLMHDSNQFLDYMYQARSELLCIDALQTIYIPFSVVNRVMREREFTAIFRYCQKIAQISLNVNRETAFRDITGNDMDFATYLSKFTRLQTLAIHFDNVLVLHDIVSACPQLESLRLYGANFHALTAKLHMYTTTDTAATTTTEKPILPVKSQLHTLVVDTSFVSKDLLDYLTLHTTHLYHLTLHGSTSRVMQSLIAAFAAYSKQRQQQPHMQALALKSIGFENYLSYSKELMLHIKSCFAWSLCRLNLTQCDFSDIRDDSNNLILDLVGLDLDYLTVDIQNVFEGRVASLNKTSLEITTSNNAMRPPKTVYFQRKSKWKPEHLFLVKESKQQTRSITSDCIATAKITDSSFLAKSWI
ncbi:hypothetical protein MBANPS3_004575 [Mucor bainieri]